MADKVKINDLFDCKIDFLKDLFKTDCFPWEILPEIGVVFNQEEYLKNFKEISSGIYIGSDVKISENVVIKPPVILSDGCEIRTGAFIRGNVICGKNCVIGNSTELKNCILLDNVQVPHYNYVGDSILGNNVHLGAGVICSNLKSDGKDVIIKGHKNYTTDLRKLGAMIGDGVEVGCGCVLNPGTIIGKNTTVYPLNSLRGVYAENSIIKSNDSIVEKIEEK